MWSLVQSEVVKEPKPQSERINHRSPFSRVPDFVLVSPITVGAKTWDALQLPCLCSYSALSIRSISGVTLPRTEGSRQLFKDVSHIHKRTHPQSIRDALNAAEVIN